MYRIVILLTLFTHFIFSATSAQVDRYMSVTHSDRGLIEVEQIFSDLSNIIDMSDSNISEELTLDYQVYLSKHISEDEMKELLMLYKRPIMQRYTNEMDMFDIPKNEMKSFLNSLKKNPLSKERQKIINELLQNIINEKLLLNFYSNMMKSYQNSNKTMSVKKKSLSTKEKKFIASIKKSLLEDLLYGTQFLTLDEMRKINLLMHSSLMKKAIKVEDEAMITILNNFIKNLEKK